MTINIGVCRGGPKNKTILVEISDAVPGYELRETGRYVFDRRKHEWIWREETMGSMKDTLGDTPFYPQAPGFKEPTTSREAASKIAGRAPVLRERVHAAIAAAGERGLTADEAAAAVGATVLAVRPRVTELASVTPPRIVATKETRRNESGLAAKVWRAA